MMFVMLENTTQNHNKFYSMYGYSYFNIKTKVNDRICLTINYGKINTEGRTIFKDFDDISDLIDFVRKKIEEKLNKGYDIIKERGFDQK